MKPRYLIAMLVLSAVASAATASPGPASKPDSVRDSAAYTSAGIPVTEGISGSWFNPDQSGHGFTLLTVRLANGQNVNLGKVQADQVVEATP